MPSGVEASAGNMPSEIAQRGRAQQRVGDRVQCDVAVGMTVEPRCVRELEAAQRKRPAGSEGMRVGPESDPIAASRAERRRGPLQRGEGPPEASL